MGKRDKLLKILPGILFWGVLAAMGLGCMLLPGREFSDMEKRYLAKPPVLTGKALTSGTFSKDAETFLTDHIPGRDLLVGIHGYLELLTGRQGLQDIRLAEGKLLEAPVANNEAAIDRNLRAISAFADGIGQDVDVMLIPSAGWAAGVPGYSDGETIAAVDAQAEGRLRFVSVLSAFRGKPELYYNTDHHWTSQGAYTGYRAYMAALGQEAKPEEIYTKEVIPGFRGSTFARSALWLTKPESLELWKSETTFQVENAETQGIHDGLFYRERLEGADPYMVFLDGNHSLVRVHNPEKTGKLLVIRDSYSNCLGTFLAENFGEVVLADLRYYRLPVSELVKAEGFDHILVCYSCPNFLTDTNLPMLR